MRRRKCASWSPALAIVQSQRQAEVTDLIYGKIQRRAVQQSQVRIKKAGMEREGLEPSTPAL